MQWIKLIGVLIIVLGFVLNFDTIATVVLAGLATALVSGISLTEFLEMLGDGFVSQRIVSVFFITLPMIGLSESFGLKERAVMLIEKIEGLTVGLFLSLYLLIRELAGLFSFRIGGHAEFVRPLVQPMAEAAARAKMGELNSEQKDLIKAQAAATENMGNFYAQNTFLGASGVLLIEGTLSELGYSSTLAGIARWSLPVAILGLILGAINYWYFEKHTLKAKAKKDEVK